MGLSKLSTKCQKCPYVLTCEHKEMEALAYINPYESSTLPHAEETAIENRINAVQLNLVKHGYRDITIGESTTVTIDLEDLKKQIEKSFYKSAGLMFVGDSE